MKKKVENKKIGNIILENRYKISVIMIVALTIIGFFINNIGTKEWFFTTDKVLSLWCNMKFFAMCLASYELFFIITNKNKNLSVAGTIVLAFSGCVMWNHTKYDSLILGEIITILIHKLIECDSKKKNILYVLTIIGCSIIYIYTFRPYAVAFGYVFLALIVWILAENAKKLKENKGKLWLVVATIILSIISAMITELCFTKTYGENILNVSSGFSGIFTYLYNILLPFYDITYKELFGGIISLAPFPMMIALYYMYKNEKHANFLLPITIIAVLETIYCISGFPESINKFTMLSGVSPMRVVPAVQLANLFIMFYFLGNIDDFKLDLKYSMRIAVISICILPFIQYPQVFMPKKFLYIFVCELCMLIFMFLNYSENKYQNVFIKLLGLLSLIAGIPVFFLI